MCRIVFVFFIIINFFSSAQTGNNDRNTSKTMYLENALMKTSQLCLSEIAQDVRFVMLNTTKESLLGEIKGVIILQDNIIVYDHINNVLLFSSDGSFISRIGNIGKGPGEYLQVSDVSVDLKDNRIYILTGLNETLLSYDFDNNFYPTNIPAKSMVSFCSHNNRFYRHIPSNFFARNNEINEMNQLKVSDRLGIQIASYHPVNSIKTTYMDAFIEEAYFSGIKDGKLYYHIFRDNNVYCIENNSFQLAFHLDCGKYSFPENYKWDFQNHSESRKMDKVCVTKVGFSNNIIFIDFWKKGKSGKLICYGSKIINVDCENGESLIDDIDGTGKLSYEYFVKGNLLIEPISSYKLLKKDNKLLSGRLRSIKEDLSENDNVILRIVTLKD
jgi:hypothetical protein